MGFSDRLGIISIILGILGIVVSIVTAIITYVRGKRNQTLGYFCAPTNVITDEISNIPKLKITMADEPINNLVSTEVCFYNIGNTSINESDFPKAAPLLITSSGHFFDVDSIDESAIKSNNENLNPSLTVIRDNELQIKFDYLKAGQMFSLSLWHDGDIAVRGDLMSGKVEPIQSKPIQTNKDISPLKEFPGHLWRYIAYPFCTLFIAILLLLISTSLEAKDLQAKLDALESYYSYYYIFDNGVIQNLKPYLNDDKTTEYSFGPGIINDSIDEPK